MNRRLIDGMSLAMSDVYAACVDRILINLARHFAFIKEGAPIPGSWEYQFRKLAEMGQVTRESEAIILDTLGGADEALKAMLEETIQDSLKGLDKPLKKAAERGLTLGSGFLPEIAPRQMQAFQAYYQQSADKLNLVNTVMLESTEQAYRATVADIATKIDTTQKILNKASGEVITGTESFNKVLHDSVRQMVANGLTGFIDHGGHHWSPEAYVAMDTRTTMTNTARAAVWEEAEQYGVDLYQVSSHDGARPLCYPWQGKVISRNGWTGVVEDGEGNKVTVHSESEIESFRYGGGLFGVNCGHYPIPFVPGFSRIRPPEQNAEENAKEYEQSQQQRALERNLREERRELAVMKAQGATEDEINAQKLRVKNASTRLDDFCDETGRARQRAREYTPINASFEGAKTPPYSVPLSEVSTEYRNTAHPGFGTVTRQPGFYEGGHQDEIKMADFLHEKFGGNITLMAEENIYKVRTPEYTWRGKYWELKTPESIKGIDGLVHTGLKQIAQNSGGIIIDVRKIDASFNDVLEKATQRIRRSARDSLDLMIVNKGDSVHVYRYKKR